MADEEKQPLNPKKGKKGEEGKNDPQEDRKEEEKDTEGNGCAERYEGIGNNGDKFIYSLEELKQLNKEKEEDDEVEIIHRCAEHDFEPTFGIRADPDGVSWGTCAWSILVPWHMDWLALVIYLVFAIYFWIETFLVMGHSKREYKLSRGQDFDLMFLATLGIAVSLTTTTVFLLFYSVSLPVKKFLESLDYMGKMVMMFFYTFAFVACEMPAGTQLYYSFMFILVAILVLNLVLVQYAMGRAVSYWTSMAVLIAIYISDFLFNSSPKEKDVFYIPMFVELAILGCGYLLYVYQVPERFCRGSKFVQLYTTGFIIFTIMLINFIFEAHNILYYTIKLNSGYYEDDSEIDWWKTTNIYHKS